MIQLPLVTYTTPEYDLLLTQSDVRAISNVIKVCIFCEYVTLTDKVKEERDVYLSSFTVKWRGFVHVPCEEYFVRCSTYKNQIGCHLFRSFNQVSIACTHEDKLNLEGMHICLTYYHEEN